MNAIVSHPLTKTVSQEIPAPVCPWPNNPRLRTLVVVPCYNEARRFNNEAFACFMAGHPDVDFIFVNDGSTDATDERLEAFRAHWPQRVTVLNLVRNAGKAEAVRLGLLYACDQGVTRVAYWDADLATPLEAIPDFIRAFDRFSETHVVFGARRQMLGHRIERRLSRRIVSRLCAFMARLALDLPIRDSQCGAKMLRNSPALRRALSEPFTAGWLFDVELFMRLKDNLGLDRHKYAFYEHPLAEWDEVPGSKVTARAIAKSGLEMLKLIARSRFGMRFAPKQVTVPVEVLVPVPVPVSQRR
ncbi:glycosyltransferase [Celeribacter persicus]|uniref:Glycosyltransferase involved in cell wall biosynthesis n=1 Tax=Celeribacter persicus TaxID=1651082 RepID=A0A2T5H9U8_9RHOB|nr:glycosyltransferase [Celeribacter persicus]PTQ68336.1 glycosyltransferase involved in cell wall biosynthesis [Celeribacter persicus]